jgi:hypothetical protein
MATLVASKIVFESMVALCPECGWQVKGFTAAVSKALLPWEAENAVKEHVRQTQHQNVQSIYKREDKWQVSQTGTPVAKSTPSSAP